jgi:hypothetical protein
MDEFHERYINGTQILVQRNKLGEWFGYVAQISKERFESEEKAVEWMKNYPMADVP